MVDERRFDSSGKIRGARVDGSNCARKDVVPSPLPTFLVLGSPFPRTVCEGDSVEMLAGTLGGDLVKPRRGGCDSGDHTV